MSDRDINNSNTNPTASTEGEKPHKRRPHYSGKYPKKFSEKYKEKNPEKYQDEIAHVISKGNTPAGMHISIMVDEILDVLDIKPGMKGLDCTLGYGGHSTAMLQKLEGNGHLYSLDVDPIEIKKTTQRLRDRGFGQDLFTPIHTNFRNIDEVAKEYGPFDFVLADLGVSSMQIDNPEKLSREELYINFHAWMNDFNKTDHEIIGHLLGTINSFSPNHDIKIPPIKALVSDTFLNEDCHVYKGIKGLQNAVLRFLGNVI